MKNLEIISEPNLIKMKEAKELLADIINMTEKIIESYKNEKSRKAVQGAIDFKTKSGIRYMTYNDNGEKFLVLIDTSDNSSVHFKVESIEQDRGINPEKFHPEKMFKQVIHS